MSCVNYWSYCSNPKCKHEHYDRLGVDNCPKCGSKCDYHVREWDEEGDHPGTFGYTGDEDEEI